MSTLYQNFFNLSNDEVYFTYTALILGVYQNETLCTFHNCTSDIEIYCTIVHYLNSHRIFQTKLHSVLFT